MTDPLIVKARECHCGHLVLNGAPGQDLHVVASDADIEKIRSRHAVYERTKPPAGENYRFNS